MCFDQACIGAIARILIDSQVLDVAKVHTRIGVYDRRTSANLPLQEDGGGLKVSPPSLLGDGLFTAPSSVTIVLEAYGRAVRVLQF